MTTLQRLIISVLRDEGQKTPKELAPLCSVGVNAIHRNLNILKDQGLVERGNSNGKRSRQWKIKTKPINDDLQVPLRFEMEEQPACEAEPEAPPLTEEELDHETEPAPPDHPDKDKLTFGPIAKLKFELYIELLKKQDRNRLSLGSSERLLALLSIDPSVQAQLRELLL